MYDRLLLDSTLTDAAKLINQVTEDSVTAVANDIESFRITGWTPAITEAADELAAAWIEVARPWGIAAREVMHDRVVPSMVRQS